MKKYTASFVGRKKGAIGIFYNIKCTVKGENKEEAKMNLYETYEHLHHLSLREVF